MCLSIFRKCCLAANSSIFIPNSRLVNDNLAHRNGVSIGFCCDIWLRILAFWFWSVYEENVSLPSKQHLFITLQSHSAIWQNSKVSAWVFSDCVYRIILCVSRALATHISKKPKSNQSKSNKAKANKLALRRI